MCKVGDNCSDAQDMHICCGVYDGQEQLTLPYLGIVDGWKSVYMLLVSMLYSVIYHTHWDNTTIKIYSIYCFIFIYQELLNRNVALPTT